MTVRVCIVVLNTFTGDSRVEKTARTLACAGADVSVIALRSPGLPHEQRRDGYRIYRPTTAGRRGRKTVFARAALFLRFLVRARRFVREAEVVWCNDLGAVVMARLWAITMLRKRRWIYDSHEFAINDCPNESRLSVFSKWVLERLCIGVADEVVCVSPSIADEYARLYGIARPHLVLNCPPFEERARSDRLRQALGLRLEQTLFLYQGILSRGRGIEVALDAFESMTDDSVVLVIMGSGELELLIRERASRSSRIRFHPAVSLAELPDWTGSADCGLILTEDSCLNHMWCLPNKLFQYLMAGVPVIAFGTLEVQRFVERNQIGIIAEPSDSSGLASAVRQFVDSNFELDRDRLAALRRTYCWEQQEPLVTALVRPAKCG